MKEIIVKTDFETSDKCQMEQDLIYKTFIGVFEDELVTKGIVFKYIIMDPSVYDLFVDAILWNEYLNPDKRVNGPIPYSITNKTIRDFQIMGNLVKIIVRVEKEYKDKMVFYHELPEKIKIDDEK